MLRTLAKLSPDDRQAFFDSLDKIFGEEAEDEGYSEYPDNADLEHIRTGIARKKSDSEKASDKSSKLGRPRPGGAMDSAAAEKSFAERYPAAMKIGHGGVSVSPKLSTPMSTATSKRFEEMFPEAAKIKVYR